MLGCWNVGIASSLLILASVRRIRQILNNQECRFFGNACALRILAVQGQTSISGAKDMIHISLKTNRGKHSNGNQSLKTAGHLEYGRG